VFDEDHLSLDPSQALAFGSIAFDEYILEDGEGFFAGHARKYS
jgi:hypothetical protein